MKDKINKAVAVGVVLMLSYTILISAYMLISKVRQQNASIEKLNNALVVREEENETLTSEVVLLVNALQQCSNSDTQHVQLLDEYTYDGEGCSH